MRLGEKIRYLRHVEGTLRGLEREMTQLEVVHAVRKELREKISQSYISQIESGARPHLTNTTRSLLARFFKVHPGYLVNDPEGYHTELATHELAPEDSVDLWLVDGAERFRRDTDMSEALLRLAQTKNSRRYLVLLGEILETPNLADRLLEVLRPGEREAAGAGSRQAAAATRSVPAKRARS
ncbi:MAG: helix-turn-helix domain-containing protein [Terriglobia bacterium]